jgi:DNA-binding NarL/FixJ family response regulator
MSTGSKRMPKLAVVDENVDLVTWVKEIGSAGEFELVGSFDHLASALEKASLSQLDVILADIPKLDGFEIIQKIKTLVPEISIISMTGHPDAYTFLRALMAGSRGFLLKPFSRGELLAAIKDVMDGRYALGICATHHLSAIFRGWQHAHRGFGLTSREEEILAGVFAGMLNKEIAYSLKIGPATVHTHLHRLFAKLKVRTRKEAVAKYLNKNPILPNSY